jgi:hypothetical protein
VKTTADLIGQLRRLGRKLGDASDPETMRYLLRCRRALHEAIEAARVADVPVAGISVWVPVTSDKIVGGHPTLCVTLRIAEGTQV